MRQYHELPGDRLQLDNNLCKKEELGKKKKNLSPQWFPLGEIKVQEDDWERNRWTFDYDRCQKCIYRCQKLLIRVIKGTSRHKVFCGNLTKVSQVTALK